MDKLSEPILNHCLIHQHATGAEPTTLTDSIQSETYMLHKPQSSMVMIGGDMHFEFLSGYSNEIIPLQSKSLGL